MNKTKNKKPKFKGREILDRLAKVKEVASVEKTDDSIIRKGDIVEDTNGILYEVTSDRYNKRVTLTGDDVYGDEEGQEVHYDWKTAIDLISKADGKEYWGEPKNHKKVAKKDYEKKLKEMQQRLAKEKEERKAEKEKREKENEEYRKKILVKRELEKQQALEKLKPILPLIEEVIEIYEDDNKLVQAFDYDTPENYQYAVTYEGKDGKYYAIVFSDIHVARWNQDYDESISELEFNEVFIDEINIDDIETGDFKEIFRDKNEETIKAFRPIFDIFYDKIYDKMGTDLEEKSEGYSKGGNIKHEEGGIPEKKKPSESPTSFQLGYQKTGNDGNLWEVAEDYKGTLVWVKAQVIKSPISETPVIETEIAEVVVGEKPELTEIQKGLLEKGFINDNLTLTNKGKRIVQLHKWCFPPDVHPFSHVYYGQDKLYPKNKSVYLAVDRATMYTGEDQQLFEVGDFLPNQIVDASVYDKDLEEKIQNTKSNRIEFTPYSYCPGIAEDKTGIGFVVFNNFVNSNELYISSPLFRYAVKLYQINRWVADSENAILIYGYDERRLKVVIRVHEQVIGLFDSFGMFDKDRLLGIMRTKYAELFIQGEDILKFEKKNKTEALPIETEETKQQKLQLIESWKELIEFATTEEEKQQYQQELNKLI